MPICENYKKCSGCQLQNMEYEEQLCFKQAKVVKLLGRFCRINEIIGMKNPENYRNKTQMAFTAIRGKTVSGVYQSARKAVVPVDFCCLDDKKVDEIIITIRRLCESFKIPPMDLRSNRGFMRHVLVRKSFFGKGLMVVLVTSKGEFRSKTAFVDELLKIHPEITTIIHNISTSDKGLMLGEKSEILFGEGFITDELCGLKFRISPRSFYQVNPKQTEILYQKAVEFANLSGKERVIDCYCGTGTIGLTMAKGAKEVIGVEINEDAVTDASFNASANGIKNARFIKGDAGEFMQSLAEKGENIDVVITDPPRAGCSLKFLKSVLALAPKRIVYVSCNPETLSRDLFTLRKGGYKVKKIQPVDMFPFTEHVETVVCLTA